MLIVNSNMTESPREFLLESLSADSEGVAAATQLPPAVQYKPVVNIPSFVFGFALASIVGTAVRLGLIKLETYTTNVYPPLLYPQIVGSFILGFMQPTKHFFKDRSVTFFFQKRLFF